MRALKLAIIGCGKRTRTVYGCFLKQLAAELEVVAVCDPVREAADSMAALLRARPFYSIRDLVAARPMEAALLVTPEESHHALSVFLSRHGVPHACETPLAPTLAQAREMVGEAARAGVVLHLAEQFFRRDVVAFSRQIAASGAIGKIGRALIHGGHGGAHDNAVLMAFAGERQPVAVNALRHVMPVARHRELYNRWFEEEPYLLRAIHFEGGFLGVNTAANPKGALGRQPRPGSLELQGSCGTFVEQGVRPEWPWQSTAEVRIASAEDLLAYACARSYPVLCEPGAAGEHPPSRTIPYHGDVACLRADLPGGTRIYRNPTLDCGIANNYLSSVALALLDFVHAVRDDAAQTFSPCHALLAAEIEAGFDLSEERQGARVEFPLPAELPADTRCLDALRQKYGVDPLDVDAMIERAFPSTHLG